MNKYQISIFYIKFFIVQIISTMCHGVIYLTNLNIKLPYCKSRYSIALNWKVKDYVVLGRKSKD